MRRLWACVVAKLEDDHARRTVMAKANAAEMKVCGLTKRGPLR
jgi:hypothetical protein